jgi:predicted RNA-binding Zn ribbon-like protein
VVPGTGGRVRFGDHETAKGFRFELSGGRLCLDLANTLDERPGPAPRERLRRYDDLVAWGEQAGLLSAALARRLRAEAERRPQAAAATVHRAHELREALFQAFSALAAGRAAPSQALAVLNRALPRALGRLRLGREGAGFRWAWDEGAGLDRMLWPVVRSAAELLVSPDRERVRECAAETCSWLFLDESRNRSRRWCDMTVCGNRDKVRRFYTRRRPRR